MATKLFSSPRTTICGICALLIPVAQAVSDHFDSDPLTTPDYGVVGAAVAIFLGLIFARDNSKSSEDVGLKERW